jgi:plasmid replication initiation protein
MTEKNNSLVKKANTLVEASYRLSTIEQKIVLTLASRIHVNDNELKVYTLSIKEFCESLGITGNNQYTRLRQTTLGLMRKAFQIQLEDDVVQVSWLSYVRYNKNKGTVDLQFAPFLKPYLLELKRNFTTYSLDNVIKLKHSYSIRLYELVKQYQTIKERTFRLDDLLQKLGLEESSYTSFGNLKLRVLTPALKELNKKTDLSLEVEQIKEGRKVVALRFIIHSKANPFSVLEGRKTVETEGIEKVREFLAMHQLEASDKLIKTWLPKGVDYVLDVLKYATKEPGITNPVGFAIHCFKNDVSVESLKQEVSRTRNIKRTEMLPDWFKKDEQQNEQQAFSVEDINLIEERKRLEEELKQYQKAKRG